MTISVLILALVSVNLLISINAVTEKIVSVVEDKVDINVILNDNASEAEINNFTIFLNNIENVQEVKFLSKEAVLEDFRQKNIGNPDIQLALDELEQNPFNNTIIIKADKPDDYEMIIQKIKGAEYQGLMDNNDFSDPKKLISFVQQLSGKVEKFGLFVAGLFSMIALLIVFNTIRVTIYTHKEEIGVMRLVGATNSFIRMPFIIESVLYAIVAVVLTIMIMYFIFQLSAPYLNTLLDSYGFSLNSYFNQNFIRIFGLELLSAVILTIISSGIAIRRYLKV